VLRRIAISLFSEQDAGLGGDVAGYTDYPVYDAMVPAQAS
jgi:hypothetical protein